MSAFTLLLDLDDTLLDTNMDAFAPAYFSALAGALASDVSPDIMLPALMGGTRAMMQNRDPALTLREVFDAYFFPRLGLERSALQEKIERFYDEIFPTLGRIARPRPEAVDFVRRALAAGHRLAIATNPYFPLKAIQHRLRWANLPPEEYPFALISSYETFHFTKETLAYFHEFLAQIGWPEGPVLMVGNDLDMDLLPARRVGLPVFWLREGHDPQYADLPQGTFARLGEWLAQADENALTPDFSSPEAIRATLRSTPAALSTLTASLPPEAWQFSPAAGEWCITEVICHLRDVDLEVSLPRVEKILESDNPFLPGVDTDRWSQQRNYISQDGPQALQDFLQGRRRLLDLLEGDSVPWSRRARHAIFGPTTLRELADFMAQHDRTHIRQIWQLLPK